MNQRPLSLSTASWKRQLPQNILIYLMYGGLYQIPSRNLIPNIIFEMHLSLAIINHSFQEHLPIGWTNGTVKKIPNVEDFSLTVQTSEALKRTLRCHASLKIY